MTALEVVSARRSVRRRVRLRRLRCLADASGAPRGPVPPSPGVSLCSAPAVLYSVLTYASVSSAAVVDFPPVSDNRHLLRRRLRTTRCSQTHGRCR